MGGRGRNITVSHTGFSSQDATPEPLATDVGSYMDVGSWSDSMLNMMGNKYSRAAEDSIDSLGFSATKEALHKEYRRRHGSDPSWGK
jgi:hypothetical protein